MHALYTYEGSLSIDILLKVGRTESPVPLQSHLSLSTHPLMKDTLLANEVMTVNFENVPVKIFGVAKTITDFFRRRRKIGQTVTLEACG